MSARILNYILAGIIGILCLVIFYILTPESYPCQVAIERYECAYRVLLEEYPEAAERFDNVMDEITE